MKIYVFSNEEATVAIVADSCSQAEEMYKSVWHCEYTVVGHAICIGLCIVAKCIGVTHLEKETMRVYFEGV